MTTTDKLINDLSEEIKPRKPAGHPLWLFLRWSISSVIYIAIAMTFCHIRSDLAVKLTTPLYLAEIISLGLVVISSGYATMLLSFPDMHQKRLMIFAPLLPFAAFIVTLAIEWSHDNPPSPVPIHGGACIADIMTFSALPALMIFIFLKKQATTNSYLAGGMAFLSSFGMGSLALRLVEQTDSIEHLVYVHYLPMMGISLLGVIIGRLFLRW